MVELTKVKGIGPTVAKALVGMGIVTAEDLAAASPETVARVRGISSTGASVIIAAAGEIAGSGDKATKKSKTVAKNASKAKKKSKKKPKKKSKKKTAKAEKKAKRKATKAEKKAAKKSKTSKKKVAKAQKKAAKAQKKVAKAQKKAALNRAIEVLGDEERAVEWMGKMSGTFGKSPKETLSDEDGFARVLSHLRGVELALSRN